MIRRLPHGATKRPPVERPGNGYGRPGKPGPPRALRGFDAYLFARAWDPADLLLALAARQDVSAPDVTSPEVPA